MNNNAKTRQDILEVLYKEREAQAGMLSDGWTAEADIKNAVGNVAFSLSVLEEIGHIKRDGYLLRITGAGVLACEANRPS